MPFSKVRSWFTGYAPDSDGSAPTGRYNAYWGGGPRYREFLSRAERDGYDAIMME